MKRKDFESILLTALSVACGLYLIDAIFGQRKPTIDLEDENTKIMDEAIRRTNKIMIPNSSLRTL